MQRRCGDKECIMLKEVEECQCILPRAEAGG